MTRVKRGVIARKRRKSILKQAKGYRWGRKNKERLAREALLHAGVYAFQHRKKKKGEMRGLWNAKISGALEGNKLSYSKLMHLLKTKNSALNRKMLAEIAMRHPAAFSKIIEAVGG